MTANDKASDQMTQLQRALEIAVTAHSGQHQKDGTPYALHPTIRLMFSLGNPNARILALLHDVVEDTDTTFEKIESEGFPAEIMEALRLLTHDPEDSYEAYIERIAINPLARAVKLADLTDNMDIRRIPGPLSDKDLARLKKYHGAWKRLSCEPSPATR
jgi:(p)ppGpp synthase/HD superfamily hydrolase